MNVEKEVLVSIVENPINMGITDYVEIDTLQDCISLNPSIINSTLSALYKKGLVNINYDLVRITKKGLMEIEQVAA